MANILPRELPAAASVPTDAAIIMDDGDGVYKATPSQIVDAAPFTQSGTGAVAGDRDAKLRRIQVDIEDFGGGTAKTGAENVGAVEDAIAHLVTLGGGVLKFGVGTYEFELAGQIALASNIEIVGAGKGATVLTRTDDEEIWWFRAQNCVNFGFRDLTAIGGNTGLTYLLGGFCFADQTVAATGITESGTFENVHLENYHSDAWICAFQDGNPGYDMVGPQVRNCTFASRTGNARGPSDLGIPGGCIHVVGNATVGGTTGIVNTLVQNCYADIPHIKSFVIFWIATKGAVVDNNIIERVGTLEIADDVGGYAFLYGNETVGAQNCTDIVYSDNWVKAGKSAGIYSANWGGHGGRITIRNFRCEGIRDTKNATRPKGALAFTDSSTQIVVDGLDARQCVAGVDVPLAGGGSIDLNNIKITNYAATVAVKSEQNTGDGSLTLSYSAPVLSGFVSGDYSATVTSGGGTATPTFTVKRPNGTTVGTYTVGGAAFATQIGFTIATGTVNFATGDTFIVTVYAQQPIASASTEAGVAAIRIGKQPGWYNRSPSGTIRVGRVTIIDQGAGNTGIEINATNGNGELLTYGPILFDNTKVIETRGYGLKMWTASEANPAALTNAYQGGVYLSGPISVMSVGRSRAIMIRATSSYIDWGAEVTTTRSPDISGAAAAQVDIQGCQSIHFRGSLVCVGQGAHASDAPAFDASRWTLTAGPTYSSTKGSIALDAIRFLNTAAAYRVVTNSLGTTGATYDWVPTVGNASVANIAPALGDWIEQVYLSGGWAPQGVVGLKVGGAVSHAAGSAPTKAEFDALVDAVKASGIAT